MRAFQRQGLGRGFDRAGIKTPDSRRAMNVVDQGRGVNPSDLKAATGLMPYAVFPRARTRFPGTVVDGPAEWIKEVFGTPAILVRRDGTHASSSSGGKLVENPRGESMEEAAGIRSHSSCNWGFRRAGLPELKSLSSAPTVGQAAVQFATWCGASVIGVVGALRGACASAIVSASTRDVSGG
jgi:hypothetical protein